jgi:hypothetical protein
MRTKLSPSPQLPAHRSNNKPSVCSVAKPPLLFAGRRRTPFRRNHFRTVIQLAEVRFWHEADLPRCLLQVRYQVKSGRQILRSSLSAFDPVRSSGSQFRFEPFEPSVTRPRRRRRTVSLPTTEAYDPEADSGAPPTVLFFGSVAPSSPRWSLPEWPPPDGRDDGPPEPWCRRQARSQKLAIYR